MNKLKQYTKTAKRIEKLDHDMQRISDEGLRTKTDEFIKRLKNGSSLDDILAEAYAVVREASSRVLGLKHHQNQIVGGIALHNGDLAELQTGEGKTLVATLPAYLNALTGKGVNIITVNDYLAKRDAEEMGRIFSFLGLTTGVVLHDMEKEERREAYNCDITYVTNNEFGFDYLKDNMVTALEDKVQREMNFCIIDEIDSILIDEARTPLIISGQGDDSSELFNVCDKLVKSLKRGTASGELTKLMAISGEEVVETGDYVVNEKDKEVHLTDKGVSRVEKVLGITNYADAEHIAVQHNMNLALRANALMKKDKDYVVSNGEILVVDEFTGRIMPGRRYSDGLHQAIEAKEGVQIKSENKTLATITFQNLFNKFKKLSGMTGTADTERSEFKDIYGLDVVVIPSNKPVIRKDMEDLVFLTKKEKYEAIIKDIKKCVSKRQPVLVGTTDIAVSEHLSSLLNKEGISHQVLNAKYHEMEAEIIAHAGEAGTVTVATNMAGRGTDIKIDDDARYAGGLKVIGCERNEARRIDNQLRGRSGRQGDPGESVFYLSMEDDLLKLFCGEKTNASLNALKPEYGEPLTHKILSKAIRDAQKRIEGNNFGIRKSLLDYDRVNNEQREIIYAERNKILAGSNMKSTILAMIEDVVDDEIKRIIPKKPEMEREDIIKALTAIARFVPLTSLNSNDVKGMNRDEFSVYMQDLVKKLYAAHEKDFYDPETMSLLERMMLLRMIDEKWKKHLSDLEILKQNIRLEAYAQRDPKTEYRIRSFELFDKMISGVKKLTITALFFSRSRVVKRPEGNSGQGAN